MSIPFISFRDAEKRIDGKPIIQGLNLTVHQGETLAVLGENGSGKSTLLKLIGGLFQLSSGERKVHQSDRMPTVGYVPDRFPKVRFRGYDYLRHMGSIRGMPKALLERRIQELFSIFGFSLEAAGRPIRQYSKGMIQKINIMQALLEPPDLLLLDEPYSGLDSRSQDELSQVLMSLKAQNMGIVLTSHEKGIAQRLSDRTILIEQGRIKEVARKAGDSDMMHSVIECRLPASEALADWALKEGVLECKATGRGFWFRVKLAQSDAFLKSVLNQQGHIYSVEEKSGRTGETH